MPQGQPATSKELSLLPCPRWPCVYAGGRSPRYGVEQVRFLSRYYGSTPAAPGETEMEETRHPYFTSSYNRRMNHDDEIPN